MRALGGATQDHRSVGTLFVGGGPAVLGLLAATV